MRIGHGFDVHRLTAAHNEKPKLIIGGVEINHNKVLEGHSDADVLVHAIIDALFGAAGIDDIGCKFPDNDPKYKNISSLELLKLANGFLGEENFNIVNIDCTIMAEKPKLRPFIGAMKEKIAETLQINSSQINIKATTTEKLGFVGREEGIAAESVCLLQSKN